MSNLAQNIITRPSPLPSTIRRRRRLEKPAVNRWCRPERHAASCFLGRQECQRRVDELRPFASPRVVMKLPYAVALQISEGEWMSCASMSAVPDVAACIAEVTTANARSGASAYATGTQSFDAKRAIGVAQHMSNYRRRLMPVADDLRALLDEHGRRVPPAALCSWLGSLESRLRVLQAAFYIELERIDSWGPAAFVRFDIDAVLGVLTRLSLEHVALKGGV